MEARPNDPGTLGTDREEGRSSRVLSSKGTVAARTQKTGTGFEENWSFLGTEDPAFWLKEPDQE